MRDNKKKKIEQLSFADMLQPKQEPQVSDGFIRCIEKEFKTILNVRRIINNWFWDKYGINPYNGCSFSCIYCDSRSDKYHLHHDFHDTIVVKKHIAPMLEARLSNARKLMKDVVGIGGTTDPYQPAEARYKNTQQVLSVLLKHRWPVHLCTKSRLVLRDITLFSALARASWCTVSVTITTDNPELSRFLEPRAPLPQVRFSVITEIKKRAPEVQCGVLYMPLAPGINDTPEDIARMVQTTKAAGADYMLFSPALTLRDTQALLFLKTIDAHYRHLIPEYERLYRFTYNPEHYAGSYSVDSEYAAIKYRIFHEACQKFGMPERVRRYIPDDWRAAQYAEAEHLFNVSYVQSMQGINSDKLFWQAVKLQETPAQQEPEKRGDL